MKKRIQLLPSGIPLVDFAWGGFYRGGTYLLMGPHKSGRTILSLQFAMECAKANETCLFFTSVRPKDLLINAASIDFDLQHYMNNNTIIVVRVTPPTNIEQAENPDSYLVDYIKDISNVVNQYQPSKVVFDEVTPFVGFRNLALLKDAFLRTIENIEDHGVTSLFVIGEPATPGSQKIADTLLSVSTGLITLKKSDEFVSKNQPGQMTITPLVGHAEGKFSSKYFIEAYRGVKVDFKPRSLADDDFSQSFSSDKKYKSMAEFELPEETFSLSNLYSVNDFKLILNNQIAFYKSTGKGFTLISIRLDETAERGKLLTMNQLQNAIRLSTERKDKICTIGNKVLVLYTKESDKDINSLVAKIKENLPNEDSNYVSTLLPFISIYPIKVNEAIRNADDLFEQLFADETLEKFKFGYS